MHKQTPPVPLATLATRIWSKSQRAQALWGVSLGMFAFTAVGNLCALSGSYDRARIRQTEALIHAVSTGNTPGVYQALQKGAYPDGLQEDNTVPPVCRAAWQDDYQTINLLLLHRANPNASCGDINTDGSPDTPLYLAALSHNPALVQVLLQRGANPNDDTERKGESRALRAAAWRGHEKAVNALLDAGANPYTRHVVGTGPRAKAGPLVTALKAAGWRACADQIQKAQKNGELTFQ